MVKYLFVSLFLFFFGFLGIFFANRNLIIILVSLELILLSVSFNFVIFSNYLDDILGEIFSLFILTVAAAESAIGLALFIVYYRLSGTLDSRSFSFLKG